MRRKHEVEVDISGAVAQTGVHSVFAFSNGDKFSVLVSSKTKKLALKYFRLMTDKKSHEAFYFRLYISGLIILLSFLKIKDSIVVLDTELYGQDEKIRRELVGYFLNGPGAFHFKQIGRKSPAHKLAKSVFLKEIGAKKVVTFNELKKYLMTKKKIGYSQSQNHV